MYREIVCSRRWDRAWRRCEERVIFSCEDIKFSRESSPGISLVFIWTVRGWGRGESDEGKPVVPFFKEELVQVHQNIPDWLVDFDSSCQHSEVHYVDWKCDALAMRFHISSSWCVVKWFKINNTVNGEYHPRKQEKTFWGRIPLLESRALKVHHLLTFNELVCFTSLQESLLHWVGKAIAFALKLAVKTFTWIL